MCMFHLLFRECCIPHSNSFIFSSHFLVGVCILCNVNWQQNWKLQVHIMISFVVNLIQSKSHYKCWAPNWDIIWCSWFHSFIVPIIPGIQFFHPFLTVTCSIVYVDCRTYKFDSSLCNFLEVKYMRIAVKWYDVLRYSAIIFLGMWLGCLTWLGDEIYEVTSFSQKLARDRHSVMVHYSVFVTHE